MMQPLVEHLVFVDFENVPEVDLASITEQRVHVTLVLGKNQKKLDVTLVEQIQRLGERVGLLRVDATGHNALDLILSYHLGLAARHGPQTRFYIVSKDTDFDPLIAHVRANGITIERHASFASLPFVPKPKKSVAAQKAPVDRRVQVIARLTDPASTNRPSTEKALRAHIKTALGKDGSDAAVEDVIRILTSKHEAQIDPSTRKVSYGG